MIEMSNPHPKLENLKAYKPKWRSGKTQTIRIPIAIASLVLEDAKVIDSNGHISLTQVNQQLIQQNEYLTDELNRVNQEKKNLSITDTSKSIDKKQAYHILSKCLSTSRSGEIKNHLAELGALLGFQVERGEKNKWIIYDTSD